MKHKGGAGQVITRLMLLAAIGVGGFVGYQKIVAPMLANPETSGQLSEGLKSASGQVQGLAAKLNIDTTGIADTASKKLVESQPIINENSSGVLGDTTSNLSDSARTMVEDAAGKISDQIKDLPKQEAAKITRQVCDQIIADLEK